jgi:hypothetical protein
MASTSRVRWSTASRKTSNIRRYHGGSARTQLAEFVRRLGPRPARTYKCPEARLLAPTPAEVKLRVFGFTDWLQAGRGQVLDSTIHRACKCPPLLPQVPVWEGRYPMPVARLYSGPSQPSVLLRRKPQVHTALPFRELVWQGHARCQIPQNNLAFNGLRRCYRVSS